MIRFVVLVLTVALLLPLSSVGLQLRKKKLSQKRASADDAAKYADDIAKSIEKDISKAADTAMKFQEEGQAKISKAESKRADEGAQAEEGLKLEPAPGQNDEPVTIRNPEDYMDEIEATTDFMGSHSYENDIKELLGEIDESENKVKGLKLRIVEKENFVSTLTILVNALKTSGVIYVSLKQSESNVPAGGRHFSYYSADEVNGIISDQPSWELLDLWFDKNSECKWINFIAKRL